MRERIGYREELEQLNEMFPNKNDLTATDIMRYCGISRNTLKKRYPEFAKGCTKIQLAKIRC